jgi:xanthine/CO dehydrogenase XdhC/CoxF family maturation factor
MLDRLISPIGISDIKGKSPAHVALSIAADLAIWQQLSDDAEQRGNGA